MNTTLINQPKTVNINCIFALQYINQLDVFIQTHCKAAEYNGAVWIGWCATDNIPVHVLLYLVLFWNILLFSYLLTP